MKRLNVMSTLLFCLLLFSSAAYAQLSRKDLKVPGPVKKEAKQLKKEGWKNIPGGLPLQNQLAEAWYKQRERDEETGYPKWLYAAGNGVGQTQTAAKLQAIEVAKLELGGLVQTEIRGIVETSIANQQLNTEEAASVNKVVAGAKNIISSSLGRVIVVYEAIKNIKKSKTVEVQVRVFYNQEKATEQAKKVLRKKLEEETDLIQDKLDAVLGLN